MIYTFERLVENGTSGRLVEAQCATRHSYRNHTASQENAEVTLSLVNQLVELVSNEDTPLSKCLLKAQVLASELDSSELKQWVTQELNGYPQSCEVPSYRCLTAIYYGHFDGVFGARVSGVVLPIPEDFRDVLSLIHTRESVAVLQKWIGGKDDAIKFVPPADIDFFRKYTISTTAMC
jgi:hypothetical protein